MLSDPAAKRIATAIIGIDLIVRDHGAAAAQITDDTTVTPIIGLADGGNGEAKGGDGGDESKELFHSVVNCVFAAFRRGSLNPIQPLRKFFSAHRR